METHKFSPRVDWVKRESPLSPGLSLLRFTDLDLLLPEINHHSFISFLFQPLPLYYLQLLNCRLVVKTPEQNQDTFRYGLFLCRNEPPYNYTYAR